MSPAFGSLGIVPCSLPATTGRTLIRRSLERRRNCIYSNSIEQLGQVSDTSKVRLTSVSLRQ